MRAVVYCRVSTKEQTKNLSLPAQRKACSRFCEAQGWKVDRVFVERGESAKTRDRTELKRLMEHCRTNRDRLQVVVVYSLDRLARSNHDHFAIRAFLAGLGITLRSVSQPIDESPTGKLMEGVLAAIAQFDNDLRAEKTTMGMKEALKRGRWTFPAPLGYLNVHLEDGTKTIQPDPQRAPLVRRAFELFATGLYSKREVLGQVSASGLRTRKGRRVGDQSFGYMLKHPLYAGRIRNDAWGIDVAGDFEPIVDEHTFFRVQAVLRDSKAAGKRHLRQNPDFPLRRFVCCGVCESPLTGGWSRSKTGRRYGYYNCAKCRGVSERKEALEKRFLDLLDSLRPKPEYLEALRESVLEVWRERQEHLDEIKPILQEKLTSLEEQKKRLVDAFVYKQAIDEETYKSELDRLRAEITVTRIERNDRELDALDVETVLEFAEHVVLNARRLWSEFQLKHRRRLQKVLFPEGLAYDGEAFRTPVTCLFFRDLERSEREEYQVVARTGIEPTRSDLPNRLRC